MLLLIEMLKHEEGPIRAEVEKLRAQLASRKAALDAKPQLVVRGSGSGALASSTPLFFVECNATGIVIHHPAGPQPLSTGSIGLNPNYDDFLHHVASTPKAMVVFLLRASRHQRARRRPERPGQRQRRRLRCPRRRRRQLRSRSSRRRKSWINQSC